MSRLHSKLVLFTLSSTGHFIATGAALLASFGASMDRFDSGRAPTFFESAIATLFTILTFPVLPLVHQSSMRFPGLWGYLPFAVNSLLWGSVICLLLAAILKAKQPNKAPEPTP